MESEQFFEMRFTDDFERHYRVNDLKYFVMYASKRSRSDGNKSQNIFAIRNKSKFSVFFIFKLYGIHNGNCILTKCSVLEKHREFWWLYSPKKEINPSTNQKVLENRPDTFKVNLGGYNCNFDIAMCSLLVTRYEKNKSLLEETKKAKSSKSIRNESVRTESRLHLLSSDMRRLLEQSELSDVILSAGSNEFRAHKLILSARSRVFFKMFQDPTNENCENRVPITDISPEVLKEMLNFIYTGVVTIKDMKMARDLYVAAHKYNILELGAACLKSLQDVDLDSVLDTLVLAEFYGDEILKQSALDFISANYSQLEDHEKWESFITANPVLAAEVLSFVHNNTVSIPEN